MRMLVLLTAQNKMFLAEEDSSGFVIEGLASHQWPKFVVRLGPAPFGVAIQLVIVRAAMMY